MSAFDSFVVWTWHTVRNLLLLLLVILIVPILRLIVVVLVHSIHIVLHVISVVSTTVVPAHVLATAAAETLKVALILHTTSAKVLVTTSGPWLLSSHLLVLSRSLVAILILDALLSQYKLFRSERISWLAELLVSMSEMALLFE